MGGTAAEKLFKYIEEDDIKSLRCLCEEIVFEQNKFEETDAQGNTPLLKACRLGNLRAVAILLRFGANIKAINKCGYSTLDLSIVSGNLRVVRILLMQHAFGLDAIMVGMYLAEKFKHKHIFDFFIGLNASQASKTLMY